MNNRVIYYLFLFFRFLFNIDAAHFNGGSIRWIPVNPYDNSSSITITVIQSYWWVYPTVNCNSYVPLAAAPSSYSLYNLNCIANCSTDGGYSSSSRINYITDCISVSQPLGMIMSERAVNLTLTADAYFYLAFVSSAWRTLYNPLSTALTWSISALINLQRQPNGLINTPPTARVASPQFVIVNTPVQIPIIIDDVNEGDDIRCRWSQKPTAAPVDECGGVCFPASMPNGTTLSNCTLFFQGFTVGVWYAAAMQIEDFINTTSTSPMSSTTVQFLISVIATPTCPTKPIFLPLEGCLQVQMNTPITVNLFLLNLCDPNTINITDVLITYRTSGMNISTLQKSSTNASLYSKILTWTPQENQLGTQQLCMTAYTNEYVQSVEYCYTFMVVSYGDLCSTTTTTTTLEVNVTSSIATTSEEEGPSWGLIAGIVASALPLTLCSICCLHRMISKSNENNQEPIEVTFNKNNRINVKHASQKRTSSFMNENMPIEVPSRSFEIYDIQSRQNSTNTISSTADSETSLLVSMYNNTNAKANRTNSLQSSSMNRNDAWIQSLPSSTIDKYIHDNQRMPTITTTLMSPFNLNSSSSFSPSDFKLRSMSTNGTNQYDMNDWSQLYLIGHDRKN